MYPPRMYTSEMIDDRLHIQRYLIPQHARLPLAEALSLLPKVVVDFVFKSCTFISEKADGSCHSLDCIFFKDMKYIILLNPSLWRKSSIKIAFAIAHEVAHAFKGHSVRNVGDMNVKKSRRWEKEANNLTIKWLSRHYKRKDLLKIAKSYSK